MAVVVVVGAHSTTHSSKVWDCARVGFPPPGVPPPPDPLLKHQSPPALSGGFQSPEQYIKHIKAGLWRSKLVLVALINFDWHHYIQQILYFLF